MGVVFGYGEDQEESDAEGNTGDRGRRLGQQVSEGGQEQNDGDGHQPQRHFFPSQLQVPGDLPLAVFRFGVTQNEHGQGLKAETPDHAEGIQRSQEVHVAAADYDGDDLQHDDQVDQPVGGAVAAVRPLKPRCEHAVFAHAVEHAVRAHDGRVHRPREDQRSHQHHEEVE